MATNRAYLPFAATALLSLVRATSECRVHAHVLHDGDLTEDDEHRLRAMIHEAGGEFTLHPLDLAWLTEFPSKGAGEGDRISWGRLALPELLTDVDRVIYLDADILVCKSIGPLMALDLKGAPAAAVRNVVQPPLHQYVRDLGIEGPRDYFNAGVLVLDLARMREEEIVGQVRRYVAHKGGQLYWFDQDALNVILANRWHVLHPRWNTQNSFWTWSSWAADAFGPVELDEAKQQPSILHFEGPPVYKPWHFLCQHPFTAQYRTTFTATPWGQTPLIGRTIAARLIAHLPREKQLPAYASLTSAREYPGRIVKRARARAWALRHRRRADR
jgi:lipopolysaccharide biosynthesis glycosyltransferase